MGTVKHKKIIILLIIFSITCGLVYATGKKDTHLLPAIALSQGLETIPGYSIRKDIPFDDDILTMLDMDDYIYADFSNTKETVNLFISQFYDAERAYAAHSPLICYPSHGWKIERSPKEGKLQIGNYSITYNEITATNGERRDLILYWYQARTSTSMKAYINKIFIGYNKLFYGDERHGFIRIVVPFRDIGYKLAKEHALHFISAFFPRYIAWATREKHELPATYQESTTQ